MSRSDDTKIGAREFSEGHPTRDVVDCSVFLGEFAEGHPSIEISTDDAWDYQLAFGYEDVDRNGFRNEFTTDFGSQYFDITTTTSSTPRGPSRLENATYFEREEITALYDATGIEPDDASSESSGDEEPTVVAVRSSADSDAPRSAVGYHHLRQTGNPFTGVTTEIDRQVLGTDIPDIIPSDERSADEIAAEYRARIAQRERWQHLANDPTVPPALQEFYAEQIQTQNNILAVLRAEGSGLGIDFGQLEKEATAEVAANPPNPIHDTEDSDNEIEQADLTTLDFASEFGQGVLEGFFVDGAWGTITSIPELIRSIPGVIRSIPSLVDKAGTGGFHLYDFHRDLFSDSFAYLFQGQAFTLDDTVVGAGLSDFFEAAGPYGVAFYNDLGVLTGFEDRPLSPETVLVLGAAQQVRQAIIEELNGLSRRAVGRIVGAIAFEVALAYGTGGLAAAAKAGKFSKLTSTLNGLTLPSGKAGKILNAVKDAFTNLAKRRKPKGVSADSLGAWRFVGDIEDHQAFAAAFGSEIASNPVGSATLRQLRNIGDDVVVKLDFLNAPPGLEGRFTADFGGPRVITIFARNHVNPRGAASTFIHEARHAIFNARGTNQRTQTAEFLARAREHLFLHGVRPDSAVRARIWADIQRLYPRLPRR